MDKIVLPFRDDSTFKANDDQPALWAAKDTNVMRRSQRAVGGVMVPISSAEGMALTEDEYNKAKQVDPLLRMYARQRLEYGKAKESYWTSETFMVHIKQAVNMAETKYPREGG